jgi:hypothetical protein
VRALGGAAVCVAILVARYGDWVLRPRLWAEDAVIFFSQARESGGLSLAIPYAGYLHLIPRLIAWAGSVLDPSFIPAFYVASSIAVMAGVSYRILSPRVELPAKPLLAVSVVLLPTTGEVFLCPTNLQWITVLCLLVFPFTRRPASRLESAGDALVIGLCGLTGPFSAILAPLAVLHRLCAPAPRGSVPAGLTALLATGALQMGVYAFARERGTLFLTGLDFGRAAGVLGARLVLIFVRGYAWLDRVPPGVSVAALTAVLAALSVAVCRSGRWRRAAIFFAAFGMLMAGMSLVRSGYDRWALTNGVMGDRYFYLPRLAVVWVAVIAAGGLGGRSAGWLRAALVILLLAGVAVPAWTMSGKSDQCERPYYPWTPGVAALRSGSSAKVTVSPGWAVTLPPVDPWRDRQDPEQVSEESLPSRLIWPLDCYQIVRVAPPVAMPADVPSATGLPPGLVFDARLGAIRGSTQREGEFQIQVPFHRGGGWVLSRVSLSVMSGPLIARAETAADPSLGAGCIDFAAFSPSGDIDFIDISDVASGRLLERLEAKGVEHRYWTGRYRVPVTARGTREITLRFVRFQAGKPQPYVFIDRSCVLSAASRVPAVCEAVGR